MIGPTIAFSISFTPAGAFVRNSALKKLSGSWPTNPASRNPIVISFQSIDQSLRKLWATSDQAPRARQALADRHPFAGAVVLVSAVGLLGVLASLLLQTP